MKPTVAGKLEKPASHLWISGLVGIALAFVGSLALWVIARLLGIPLLIAMGPPGQNSPVPLSPVGILIVVVISALAATVFYALLRRFFNHRARRIFQILALILLLLSLGAPFSLAVPATNQVVLVLMHLVTGAAIIWALTLRK
jgi:hypothetical protein